jgi:hypothetical protein
MTLNIEELGLPDPSKLLFRVRWEGRFRRRLYLQHEGTEYLKISVRVFEQNMIKHNSTLLLVLQ